MTVIFLKANEIELEENHVWRIKKLGNTPESTDILCVEVSGKVFHLINCGGGAFIPWYGLKLDHDSQDSH